MTKLFKWLRQSPVLWVAVILLLGVVLRASQLTLPPVDYHSWRQTETAALARNYFEEGYRLFYPTVDWRGVTPGYVESELSIYAYLTAWGYGLWGFNEVIPRVLSILAATGTGYLLYLIGRRLAGVRVGVLTVYLFTFLSPFGLFFGQAMMGDMLVLFLVTLAVYAALRWTRVGDGPMPATGYGASGWFVLLVAAATLGALSKLPALYVAAPLVVLLIVREGWRALWTPRNWLAAIFILGVVVAWYAHAYRLGAETGLSFGIWNSNKVGNWGLLLTPGFYRALIYNFSYRVLTVGGVCLALGGVLLPRKRQAEWAIYAWFFSVLAYLLYAGIGVLGQDYYTLALLPPASLFMGKALHWLYQWIIVGAAQPAGRRRRLSLVAAVLVSAGLLGSAYQGAWSAREMFQPLALSSGAYQAGQWIQKVMPAHEDLIVVGSSPPEGLYFSHRHGLWKRDHYLNAVQQLPAERWPYVLLLNPYYGEYPALRDVHTRWRLLGGSEWFLAYERGPAVDRSPQYSFDPPPQWAGELALLGYDLQPAQLVNQQLYLVLHWRAEKPPLGSYVSFVHAWDTGGNFCGQDDHQPLRGQLRTADWQPGEVLLTAYAVDLAQCSGDITALRLSVGWYHPDSGERLALSLEDSEDQLHWITVALTP